MYSWSTPQERPPGRARKDTAEGAEHHVVGGLEAGPTDQTFEDAELTTEERRQRSWVEIMTGLPS